MDFKTELQQWAIILNPLPRRKLTGIIGISFSRNVLRIEVLTISELYFMLSLSFSNPTPLVESCFGTKKQGLLPLPKKHSELLLDSLELAPVETLVPTWGVSRQLH